MSNEVLITLSGLVGTGKSALAGEIEILCRALGLQVTWPDGDPEKNMTHADWTAALEMYKPTVRIEERNTAPQAVAAQAAPAAVAVPPLTPDEARWAAKDARQKNGPSDPTQPIEYVMAGALALAAKLAATPALPATGYSSAGDLAEEKIAYEMSREERMIVLQRDSDGTPTVWCDPEIADIVCALNSGGVKTVASCSGHGVKPGGIALADGRQILLLESLEVFNSAMSAITQAEVRAEPVYQIAQPFPSDPANTWRDASRDAFDLTHPEKRRVLYTAPQAQPDDALDAETIKKATRYDWLRTGKTYVIKISGETIHCGGHSVGEKYGPALDKAIDAAMAAAQEGCNASAGKDGAA